MAISKSVTLENGLVVNNAYIKIYSISGTKEKITINVNTYASKELSTNWNNNLDIQIIDFVPSILDTASNFIKQGYEHLKTLPEYQDAVDVLETGQTA